MSQRCELQTGDMTSLPFPAGTFDLVLRSLAIHNIAEVQHSKEGCLEAIDQAVRVLKPGGRLMIADIMFVQLYARRLRDLGMSNVEVRRLDWRFWYGPFMGAGLVTATKSM